MNRPTGDLVALILTVTLAVVVIGSAAGLMLNAFLHPENETDGQTAKALGTIISVLTGAVVGFMAGRKVGNGNGHNGKA